MSPPRVLLVSRNLPPLVGGMERVNLGLYRALLPVAEVAVAGPRGCRQVLAPGAECLEFSARPLPAFVLGSLLQAWRLARRRRPALVVCGSGTVAPAGLAAARACGARLAVFVHGLDLLAPHWLYQAAFLPAIRRAECIVANSRHTAELARAAGCPAERIRLVHPGVSLPALARRAAAREAFRRRHDLGERPVLLSVGRLTRRKGLAEFIDQALPSVLRARPEAVLVIGGEEASAALAQRGGVAAEIRAAAARVGAARAVRLLGALDEEALSEAYFGADLLVFPVLALPGDVEGFGMVAVEAAAHGLPVAAFAVGGVADAVAEGRSGWLLAPGDYRGLAGVILRRLETGSGGRPDPESCHAHAAAFEWGRFGERVRAALALEGA